MFAVVIFAEILDQYTAALAKVVSGILPRRPHDRSVIYIGGFSLPRPSSSPVPDFSSYLVDF
ncbi:unnamed protein product [Arabidopsis lyrata]|uniref:Uncharacterized protein n=1 Tax=Arabidopsis lyrata subsp. lyrata TaxID=81972 RepID=D7MDT1_ARALL|nr:uncharacterized protein LOC9303559 [Arabidopsis lyrata subsp. lyrata]EFH45810.1 hypothetical protein ARALYDRAFT_913764 [Arabidopsis lyrata subsp. lyrata]CAH8275137.1 unnamed protein product [Arabidopsis lyrata]|eukprot:XP_020872213.1 uncharacterized protein LOC9303559 [Arabidopsis lyrata subsp. lyrata]